MTTRLMTLLIASFCFFNATAQTEKGRFAISGQTDMSLMFGKTRLVVDSASGQKQNSKAFNANVGIAYFIANNLAIGVSGSFQYKRIDDDNLIGYLQNYVAGVIPSVTYFFPLKGNLKPNISVGAGYVWFFTSKLDAEGLSLNAAPGVSYFVNKNISLDLGIQYSYNKLKNTSGYSEAAYKQQTIGMLAGMSVYF